MIKRGRAAKQEIFRIAAEATAVFTSSEGEGEEEDGKGEGSDGGNSGADGGSSQGAAALAGLSDADVEAMDAASLRRLLLGCGQPASGRISKLRERVREVRDGKLE
jgi:hypothetical protein